MRAKTLEEVKDAIQKLDLIGRKILNIETFGVIPGYVNWEYIMDSREVGIETDGSVYFTLDDGRKISIYVDGFKGEYMGYLIERNVKDKYIDECQNSEFSERNANIIELLFYDAIESKIKKLKFAMSEEKDGEDKKWPILTLELDNGLNLIFDCDPMAEYMYMGLKYPKKSEKSQSS